MRIEAPKHKVGELRLRKPSTNFAQVELCRLWTCLHIYIIYIMRNFVPAGAWTLSTVAVLSTAHRLKQLANPCEQPAVRTVL